MSSPYTPEPAGFQGPPQSRSAWSVASQVFLALAIMFILLWRFGTGGPGAGPAEGAARLIMSLVFNLAAGLCALLGTICGWVGMRGPGSVRATLALNSALLGFILAALLLLLRLVPPIK